MKKQYEDSSDEVEIDLLELIFEFKKRWYMLLAAFFIGMAVTGAYSFLILTPQYSSEAKMYVLSKETTLASLADLQIGSQLTQDYKVMITSRPVLQQVISNLGLEDMEYQELRERIVIDNPTNTRILSISIQDPNPETAKAIVDEVAYTASDFIGEIMEMVPPKIIEDGEVAIEKTSPKNARNALIGGLVALFVVCGGIAVTTVMNDTIKTEDDVAKYLDLSVLAVVPSKVEDRDKKQRRKKKKFFDRWVKNKKQSRKTDTAKREDHHKHVHMEDMEKKIASEWGKDQQDTPKTEKRENHRNRNQTQTRRDRGIREDGK